MRCDPLKNVPLRFLYFCDSKKFNPDPEASEAQIISLRRASDMYTNEDFDRMATELYSAVLSDAMDALGYRDQAMRHDLRPVIPEAVIVGRALTVLSVDIYEVLDNPYEKEMESTDALQPGDVLVASTNRSTRNGYWGELLSTAAQARGARGAIVDGLIRDVRKIQEIGFPVFAVGYKPVDSQGRGVVVDYNCPVHCGDVLVNPGDLIFADYDGVVVIPQRIADDAIARAFEKVHKENLTRDELLKGAYLKDVYAKYGIL